MKFMEQIQTTLGPGLVVAAVPQGKILATVTRVEYVEVEKGKVVEKRYYPHRVFAWCEAHKVWYPGKLCGRCLEKKVE